MTSLAPGAALVEFHASPGDTVLLPAPISLFGLTSSLKLDGLEEIGSAPSNFGPQSAVVARVKRPRPSVLYSWIAAERAEQSSWLWSPPQHPLMRASAELTAQMRHLAAELGPTEAEAAIVAHVASVFRYGHGEVRFTDGANAVPALSCGLTRGSCVDIHTYAVAALRAVGVRATYVAGVFWPDGEDCVQDMHCWVATNNCAWDISHDIIARRTPQLDFDAIPGRRLPFSVGRGQRFTWKHNAIEVSHFALPHRLTDSGAIEVSTSLTRLS